jgi:hypothetical protein
MKKARLHADGLMRCPWPSDDPFYVAYHDDEWGVPEYDDRALFEKLILDGFQAGLSWITILRKRDNFRKAFDNFEPKKIAKYDAKKIAALMNDAGIVRNRAKIEGAVASAKAYLKIMGKVPASRNCCGIMSAAGRRSTHSRPPPACPPRHRSRSRSRKIFPRAASSSSGQPSSMPSCRPSAWSTITSLAAIVTRAWRKQSRCRRPDHKDGVAGFPEKREPLFRGRQRML